LRFGAFSEIELLLHAQKCNLKSLALTDINNTSACLNFIRKSREFNIKPIVGIDFRNGASQQFIGLAKNNSGFQELNTFLSNHSHHKKEIPNDAPDFKEVIIIYPFE